jgi:glycosyl transferase, family 25
MVCSMRSCVISLKTAFERRKHIEAQFFEHNVSFQFFDALTPDKAEVLAREIGLCYEEKRLTPGELACFMSHVALWKKMLDENIPFMAIFEDDIYLGENSDLILNSSDWIAKDVEIIKLEAFSTKVIVGEKINLKETDRFIAPLKHKNFGTAGYIVSKQAAQAYFDFVKLNTLIPLDEMMFEMFLNLKVLPIYQLMPAICIQEMNLYPDRKQSLPSDLTLERKNRMKRFKKKGLAKIKVELIRILIQIKFKLFASHSSFK